MPLGTETRNTQPVDTSPRLTAGARERGRMSESVTLELLNRLTPRQRAALYRVAKSKMRPWFSDPRHMIHLRTLVKQDREMELKK